ncbi:ShlB/FhaC/HecB family hemolysin secretion/activation protein [Herbaspirillum rubrisubalbicans]|uniref:ShlB/FhaC/HecB family hemolysin secretion/activation protein n=1 Tax=Herbaspirillum rubrisubalbicans TaxID=80842 RepID=UPI000A59DD11|nr:ShlB/FhaC/HecB family hemolysin secretion/activation protein [Herbaspirillum rubrisubalbicans]
MRIKGKKYKFANILAVLLWSISTISSAQTIQSGDSEEQRRRARAEASERERQLEAPKVNLQEKVDAPDSLALPTESPCFKVDNLVLHVPEQLPALAQAAGASALPQDPFRFAQQYLDQYAGQCVGKDGLNLIVKRLTALILSKGYSTTRLGIAAQDLSSHRLELTLVPGMIRAIKFSSDAAGTTWKSAFPTGPGQLLNLRDLEQGLEQMKRVPTQDVTMEIVPGELPGESDVVITVKRKTPWKLTAALDDSGAKGTGKLQSSVNLAWDNLFGLNDLFNIGLNTDADRRGQQRGTHGSNIYYSIPYGYWTFSAAASTYAYHQQIAGLFQTFVSSGKSQNLEFTVQRLFYRDQVEKHSVQFKVAKRWNRSYVDDTELEVQRRNTTAAELAWLYTRYIGDAQFNLVLANRWGVSWFNGQPDLEPRLADAPTYRYSLQTIDASLYAPFKLGTQSFNYIGALRGQSTHSTLFLSDQFAIGNRYTVRGFDGEQTLSAERGVYLRNEIEMPLGETRQALYAGLDAGRVFGPGAQLLVGTKMAGAAIGLRGNAAGVRYDVFAGWALVKPAGLKTATPSAGFSISYQY